MPAPRRRNPLGLVLLLVIAVTLVALGGLALSGLTSEAANTAYQNDDYQIPSPDRNPPPIPVPET